MKCFYGQSLFLTLFLSIPVTHFLVAPMLKAMCYQHLGCARSTSACSTVPVFVAPVLAATSNVTASTDASSIGATSTSTSSTGATWTSNTSSHASGTSATMCYNVLQCVTSISAINALLAVQFIVLLAQRDMV